MSDSLLDLARRPHIRSEKAEQHLCDNFVAAGGGRQRVVRFSQPRNTMQTLGIPDSRYRIVGVAFWWECKAEDGRLSAEQVFFLEQELAYGCPVGVGTLEDLMTYHHTLLGAPYGAARCALACQLGQALIEKYRPRAKRAKRGKL